MGMSNLKMRKFKFRVWDSNLKTFHHNDHTISIGLNGGLVDECSIYNNKTERESFWTLQQSTGAQDRDGQEIYEGDLLSFRYLDHGGEFTGEVKYSDKFASFIVEIGKAFETIGELLEYAGSFKVAGHKYETQSNE